MSVKAITNIFQQSKIILFFWYLYLNWSNQTQFVNACCCCSPLQSLYNLPTLIGGWEKGGIHRKSRRIMPFLYVQETTVNDTIATFESTRNPHIIKAWLSFPQWLSCSIIKRERERVCEKMTIFVGQQPKIDTEGGFHPTYASAQFVLLLGFSHLDPLRPVQFNVIWHLLQFMPQLVTGFFCLWLYLPQEAWMGSFLTEKNSLYGIVLVY